MASPQAKIRWKGREREKIKNKKNRSDEFLPNP